MGYLQFASQEVPPRSAENLSFFYLKRIFDLEEPDALIGLVRLCGGFGGASPRFYPEVMRDNYVTINSLTLDTR